jgi:hypothetical protein
VSYAFLSAPFAEVWGVDFEFTRDDARPGPVEPICCCAVELRSGRLVRVWQDELAGMTKPPFDIGPDSCLIAYQAGAEAMAFAALGWPRPVNVVCLFAEFAMRTNVLPDREKNVRKAPSLGQAMRFYQLPFMDSEEKRRWRDLAIHPPEVWSREQQGGMLDYCSEDTDADAALAVAMDRCGDIDWPRAVWRGRAAFEYGIAEHHGIPIDASLYRRIVARRKDIPRRLADIVNQSIPVFDGVNINIPRFRDYLANQRIAWPMEETGLSLRLKTFHRMAVTYPEEIGPITEVIALKRMMERPGEFPIGPDNRIRFWHAPFCSTTGRCQPRGKANIMAAPAVMRALLHPPEDHALVLIDYVSQEPGLAAGLSYDPNMRADYAADFHRCIAIAVGLVTAAATAAEHKLARKRVKPISLGTLYGRGARSIAAELGLPVHEVERMLAIHRRRYAHYWAMVDRVIANALSRRRITSTHGWTMQVRAHAKRAYGDQLKPSRVNLRALQNFLMQAGGAEMTRAAIVKLGQAGFKVLTTAHDAVMVELPLASLERDLAIVQDIMERISLTFTRGVRVTTEATTIRPGERLVDKRAETIWPLILRLLEELERENDADADRQTAA